MLWCGETLLSTSPLLQGYSLYKTGGRWGGLVWQEVRFPYATPSTGLVEVVVLLLLPFGLLLEVLVGTGQSGCSGCIMAPPSFPSLRQQKL